MSANAVRNVARRGRHTPPPHSGDQPVVLVAMCSGTRCAALRRLDPANPSRARDTKSGESDARSPYSESEQKLRSAIRARREAVLISVPCLGPCSHASVTAVGAGISGPSHLSWLGRPTLIGLSERPDRAAALADWVTSAAPDPASIPPSLRTGR